MKLYIICEDKAGGKFLQLFFEPYWSRQQSHTITIKSTRGNGAILKALQAVVSALRQNPTLADYVLCLVDLRNPPQFIKLPAQAADADDTTEIYYRHLQTALLRYVPHDLQPRFGIFPIVWELETWLLADVEALQHFFGTKAIKGFITPETLEKASEQLTSYYRAYKSRNYDKGTDTASLFALASAERIYKDNCPHFNRIIDQLQAWQIGQLAPSADIQPDQRRVLLEQLRGWFYRLADRLPADNPLLHELVQILAYPQHYTNDALVQTIATLERRYPPDEL